MSFISANRKAMFLFAALSVTASGSVAAQDPYASDEGVTGAVTDTSQPDPATMTKGPDVEGIISARSGDKMQVTTADGARTVITIDDATKIKSSGGFLGLAKDSLTATQLLNGIPVSVETKQWSGGLVASRIDLKNKDLKTASMIHNGTDQRFVQNEQATEALKGRMADIDKYNIKSTTNVNFDTGKWNLSEQAKADLCAAAAQADGMNNALLLVVGYTDSVGSEDYNQMLSEKRAGRVVNYLQQQCGWKPYRMLTPTGMSESNPVADNSSSEGKAQNRRVAVNVLVSKGLDGL